MGIVLVLALTVVPAVAAAHPPAARTPERLPLVRRLRLTYRASDGRRRHALVVVPAWYGPRRHPRLPLVISPHGRGLTAAANLRFWATTPALGPFALVSPDGQGRRLGLYSWGAPGQVADLTRMPVIVQRALPWLRIDRRRIYAVGSSMGGQEVLLMIARRPHLLAGAAALDADTDLVARYAAFGAMPGGARLRRLMRLEVGGSPSSVPAAYRRRSPVAHAGAIARAGVPLLLWWSRRDRIVADQPRESGRLARLLRAAHPRAPLIVRVGTWRHSREYHATALLPAVLARLGLLDLRHASLR